MAVTALLFPVIAWYDIISDTLPFYPLPLLFPVIAWYDIITPERTHRQQ